jgi:hypothetical protein
LNYNKYTKLLYTLRGLNFISQIKIDCKGSYVIG